LLSEARDPHSALGEVGRVFLRLGCIAFGGPAAHVAMMREDVVRRRGWLDDARFLDLVGATNLIPGPNSTELAIHLGYLRGGRRGLVLAGAAFILPATLIVLALAWAYVRFGTRPAAGWLLYGVTPVIIAVVAQALWSLGRTAVKGPLTAAAGLAVLLLVLAGGHELLLLFGAGLGVMLLANARRLGTRSAGAAGLLPVLGWTGGAPGWLGSLAAGGGSVSLLQLFLFFLKVGSVLFGSGYVLLAFLRADLVERWGWLTDQQLIDAIAVGQVTPGPVFTTATFIGYVVAGVPGAVAATVGIFLPAFVFVAISHPFIPLLRRSPWAGAFLDGLNIASLALMAAVTWRLGRAALVDPLTVSLAVAAGVLLVRFRVNSAWLVLAGGVIGLLWRGVG
jgi:chromate transporter